MFYFKVVYIFICCNIANAKFLRLIPISAQCKRKDALDQEQVSPASAPKKPRLVFTDLQRRTLQAIFKVGFCSLLMEWIKH